jgi:hypothetical protein
MKESVLVLIVVSGMVGALIAFHLGVRLAAERIERCRYGIGWNDVATHLDRGEGCLVVDRVGSGRGIFGAAVWWLPKPVGTALEASCLIPQHARLVDCPRRLRTAGALRARFPLVKVYENDWVTLRTRSPPLR